MCSSDKSQGCSYRHGHLRHKDGVLEAIGLDSFGEQGQIKEESQTKP